MLLPRRYVLAASTITWLSFIPSQPMSYDAFIVGGFLQEARAYDDYVNELGRVGVRGLELADNDALLLEKDASLINDSTRLLLGHSKGAKTVGRWMATLERTIPCVLIEPVDVDPPYDAHFSVLDLWETNFQQLSSIPTLIVSAPYTDTSRRYGKAKNLCAPPGKDARAFFSMASKARAMYPNNAAPLCFAEFPNIGHNDVTSSALGGCSNGPGRKFGSLAVASLVAEWIHDIEIGEDFTLTQRNSSRYSLECFISTS